MNTLLDQRNNDDNGDGNLNNSSTLTSDEVQITITESALFSPNNISHNNDLNSIDGDFYKANYSDEKLPSYSIISKDMPPNYNKDEEAYEHRHSSNSNGDSHSSCIGNIKPGSWPITKNLYIYGFLFWPLWFFGTFFYFFDKSLTEKTWAKRCLMNSIMAENDHIILNVGGIKYETYRSTLTSYPKTLLGTMFADRNKCLLRPINDNEYFIDRNGYVFYYIIEFYRTGKIFWKEHNSNHLRLLQQNKHKDINHSGAITATTPIIPDAKLITREELEEELHYFQIPLSCIWTSLKQRAISYKIDLFVEALRDVYFEILSEFETKVEIKFRRNKLQPHIVTFSSDSSDLICKLILNIINPFESCGYTLLDKFGTEIGCYLKNTIPDLHWELSHVDNFNWYCVKMFSTESFNYESILQNSCLGNNNIHHRIIDD
ncbi:11557_t:CDS:2 [Entrophospora sp. SA101]|nr:11557_t:CDS:2 [Entrophospora sp. SA101]